MSSNRTIDLGGGRTIAASRDYPWPTPAEIAGAHDEARPLDRSWSKFPLDECRHPLMVGITTLGVGQPDWNVEICPDCGHVTSCCNHNRAEWNDAGTLLRCTTCGTDGT